jgi:phage terminase large subunit-like protein
MSAIEEARRALPGPVFEALYEARQPSEGMGLFNTARLIADEDVEEDPTWRRVRAWDMAASATARSDYTVGALMTRGLGEEVTVPDIVRGRWEPEEVLNRIVATATADGPTVDVVLEEEKGSSGNCWLKPYVDAWKRPARAWSTPNPSQVTRPHGLTDSLDVSAPETLYSPELRGTTTSNGR